MDIKTGEIEIIRDKEVVRREEDFPFAISPSNDKVFYLHVPYEGYLFTNPFYIKKDAVTGIWGSELDIPSINMEVGGGWNIDTGQWFVSPSGRYLAVADATEDSMYYCHGMGDTPRAHNVIKVFDLETLETQTLTVKSADEDFTLNAWASDDRGIFVTKHKVQIDPDQDCSETRKEGVQEFYLR